MQIQVNTSSGSSYKGDYTEFVNTNQNFTVETIWKKPCSILEVKHIITQVYSESA